MAKKKDEKQESNETYIQVYNGQYRTTFPKQLAQALRLKHKDKIVWIFHQGDLIIRKV